MSTTDPTQTRKNDHLMLCAERDVTHAGGTLLGDVRLLHQALPELDSARVDLSTEFMGRRIGLPLMITGMTGGTDKAGELNRALASLAGRHGLPFSVGSQRILLEHPELLPSFAVRRELGDGILLGNIGGVQLAAQGAARCWELARAIGADGMCVHVNPAQEMVQPEGDRNFTGILDALAELVQVSGGQVLVKETGAGIGPQVIAKLHKIGVRNVDLSGAGGTSWTKVEMHRAHTPVDLAVGTLFSNWGIPTAALILAARKVVGHEMTLIASGGLRTPLDLVNAIVLGADAGGMALPFLRAWLDKGAEGPEEALQFFERSLRTAMTLLGCLNVAALRQVRPILTGELAQWAAEIERMDFSDKKDTIR